MSLTLDVGQYIISNSEFACHAMSTPYNTKDFFYHMTWHAWCSTQRKGGIWQFLDLSSCTSTTDVMNKYSDSRYPAVAALLSMSPLADNEYLLAVADDHSFAFTSRKMVFRDSHSHKYRLVTLPQIKKMTFAPTMMTSLFDLLLNNWIGTVVLHDGSKYKFDTKCGIDNVVVNKWIISSNDLYRNMDAKERTEKRDHGNAPGWQQDKRSRPNAEHDSGSTQHNAESHNTKTHNTYREHGSDQKRSESSTHKVNAEHYYAAVLGLSGPVNADDLRRRYRELVLQYHPDRVSHLGIKLKVLADREIKAINEAYGYFKDKYGID